MGLRVKNVPFLYQSDELSPTVMGGALAQASSGESDEELTQ